MPQTGNTVLDVIDYPSIADKRFVQIYAGVGSGKSYFAERFIEGDETHNIPQKTVLIVTSRRSKVDQTLSDKDLNIGRNLTGAWGEYHWVFGEEAYNDDVKEHVRVLKDDWGTHYVFQKSTICTNAFLEVYQKKIYHPDDITTHLWELFDIIVIDEVHSVIMDAPYQSAPFYVQELVNETLHRQKLAQNDPEHHAVPMCKQIILMTGTPDAISNFSVPSGAVTLNLMERCRNVQPENVHPIMKAQVANKIVEQLNAGSRIVYFGNHTMTPTEFCEGTDIPVDVVASSFSKEEKRDDLTVHEKKTMERVEASIRDKETIPPDIKIFVTTARNKEGINIEDKDIDIMYIESHVGSDVIQMAGRVRNGVKHLYIVQDSPGFRDKEWRDEATIIDFMLCDAQHLDDSNVQNFNSFLEYLCQVNDIDGLFNCRENAQTAVYKHEVIEKCVNQLCARFPYLEYSYFRNRFCYYRLRYSGKQYTKKKTKEFKEIAGGTRSFWDIVHPWFPEANIVQEESPTGKSKALIADFLAEHPNMQCTEDEVTELKNQLSAIWNMNVDRINATLKKFCQYRLYRKGHCFSSPNYKVYDIVKEVI